MKKTDYSNVALGQEISGNTLVHEQDAVLESLKAITRALGVDSSKVTVLFGCVMNQVGNQYDQTAGAVVYQDEVYYIDAFSGNHATQVPVYLLDNVFNGPAVRFADLQYRDVHIDAKIKLELGASGSGEADYDEVEHLKDKVATLIDMQNAINTAIASLVDSSPAALDTLNELAAALGDDPNFATTITNSIATKVAIAAIVNNLTSTDIDMPLSAAQGKVLNDNKANKNQGVWTNITLSGGWAVTGGGVGNTPRYRVDQFGMVHLRGNINAASATSFYITSNDSVPRVLDKDGNGDSINVICAYSNNTEKTGTYLRINDSGRLQLVRTDIHGNFGSISLYGISYPTDI